MEAKDFVINVGPNGTFRPSGSYQTLPGQVDDIFNRFKNDGVKKISVYFHGGLVNEKNGMDTAFKMANHLSAAGQVPLCFVWETGLMETLSANIQKISGTKLFDKIAKILIKKISEKLGFDLMEGRGAGKLLTDEQIDEELFKQIPFQSYNQQTLKASGRGEEAIQSLPENENDLLQSLAADFTYMIQADIELQSTLAEVKFSTSSDNKQARGIISTAALIKHVAVIAFKVIKRFIDKRDHDFYPTIIEELLRELYVAEIGAWIWNNMKEKSLDMWKDNSGLSGLNMNAGRYVLDKLIEYTRANNDVEINLVGHSAGSIAICNLLNISSSVNPQLIFNKIAFMAPACRIDLFNKEIVSNTTRFKKFRMFTMNNEFETRDLLVPYLYTHSLLYFISGVLEGEGKEFDSYILGLERHIKKYPPYDSDPELVNTNKFIFETGTTRIAFSQTDSGAAAGLQTKATSHGGFDDDETTINSIKYFLREQ